MVADNDNHGDILSIKGVDHLNGLARIPLPGGYYGELDKIQYDIMEPNGDVLAMGIMPVDFLKFANACDKVAGIPTFGEIKEAIRKVWSTYSERRSNYEADELTKAVLAIFEAKQQALRNNSKRQDF